MASSFYVHPSEFERCVALLTDKLQEISLRAGVAEEDCGHLEAMLAALPPIWRKRATVVLDGIQMQAAEESPAMAIAARYVLRLAEEVWEIEGRPAPAGDAGLGVADRG